MSVNRAPLYPGSFYDDDLVRLFADRGFFGRPGISQYNGWNQNRGPGGKPQARNQGKTGKGNNKSDNQANVASVSKTAKKEAASKKEQAASAKRNVAKAAAKEESDGKAAQAAMIESRIKAIQNPVPGVTLSPTTGESFTLGTRTFRITHVLSKGEVATQVEIARALAMNTLTGKPCGWYICLRSQNFELIVREQGGKKEYQVVPARSCITQINGISLRCTTDEFPVVFTSGIPGSITDQMGNKESAIFGKETSQAGPQLEHHTTRYHNLKPIFKGNHERMSVTRPYGGDAGMLYTVAAMYSPAAYNMASSDGSSIGFVNGEIKVRTYERDVEIPSGFQFVEDKIIQVVPVYDPLLLTSGGYQDSYLGGEIVGRYDIGVTQAGTGEFLVSIDSEGLADRLAPAVTYQFQDGFDRNCKALSTQSVAQPLHFKYMRLCTITGDTAKVYVFSTFDGAVNARPEVGYLDAGLMVGTENLKYLPVTGSWGSARSGNYNDSFARSLDVAAHGKKPSNYTVVKVKRHPSTEGPHPMILDDYPGVANPVAVEESYLPNTAHYSPNGGGSRLL